MVGGPSSASLDDLRADVLDLGALVVARVDDALTALETDDDALARTVRDGDDAVNERSLAIERDCIDLIALTQPVASDLRVVVASFKIVTDLERVGDLATNLAELALGRERELFPDLSVGDAGRVAVGMLENALAAYERGDAALCEAVVDQDDELDGLCARINQLVVRDLIDSEATVEADVDAVLPAVRRLLLTVREIERIGDHAVNVAARTYYAVESDAALLR